VLQRCPHTVQKKITSNLGDKLNTAKCTVDNEHVGIG